MKKDSNYLTNVRNQYEHYPYPLRDPEDEQQRLIGSAVDGLDFINFYCFEGRRDLREGGRVLVAGGGTGDAAIFLAEQLRDSDREVVYLDISEASMKIAQARAKARGLANITWRHESLLDIPKLNLGQFDYINCSGVLHHLENPAAGLKVLTGALKDDGAMTVMVYGRIGREAIYQMQELMRRVNKDEENIENCIANTRTVLNSLPPTNWYLRSLGIIIPDEVKSMGDIGIYDAFLHPQDCAYTIPELYEWVEPEGLHVLQLTCDWNNWKHAYKPETYIKDKELLAQVKALDIKQQQAFVELFAGNIIKHTFYAAKDEREQPVLDDLDNVPFYSSFFYQDNIYEQLPQQMAQSEQPKITIDTGGKKVTISNTPRVRQFLTYMDGERSTQEIFDKMIAESGGGVTYKSLLDEFRPVFDRFHAFDWILLRQKSIARFAMMPELQKRMQQRKAA